MKSVFINEVDVYKTEPIFIIIINTGISILLVLIYIWDEILRKQLSNYCDSQIELRDSIAGYHCSFIKNHRTRLKEQTGMFHKDCTV